MSPVDVLAFDMIQATLESAKARRMSAGCWAKRGMAAIVISAVEYAQLRRSARVVIIARPWWESTAFLPVVNEKLIESRDNVWMLAISGMRRPRTSAEGPATGSRDPYRTVLARVPGPRSDRLDSPAIDSPHTRAARFPKVLRTHHRNSSRPPLREGMEERGRDSPGRSDSPARADPHLGSLHSFLRELADR